MQEEKAENGKDDTELVEPEPMWLEDDKALLKAEAELVEKLKHDRIQNVTKLLRSDKLQKLLQGIELRQHEDAKALMLKGTLDHTKEYQLIVDANTVTVEIQNEISVIHKYIRDVYSKKFSDLESLVFNPIDYAKVVKRIGNETHMPKVDLTDLLPPATIMVVNVTATAFQKKLQPEELEKVLEACEEIFGLDNALKRVLSYVESRMTFIAPNLSNLVGTSIAAKLMSVAGGLTSLSKLTSSIIQILGTNKRQQIGFSSASATHAGFIYYCDIISSTPPSYRVRAIRLLSAKCALAARVDSFNEDTSGQIGLRFRDEIIRKIAKLQEPPPPKQAKPLPAPDDKPKKKEEGNAQER